MATLITPNRPASLWTVDNGALHFHFHWAQEAAWNSPRRFTFLIAGTQGGKTAFGPWWLGREIRRCGAGDYLAVTSNYDLFLLKMLPVLKETFCHTLRCGRWWSSSRVVELANPETGRFQAQFADDPMWGRIILRSASAGSGLESATAKAAWLDECGQDEFTVETWEAVLRRLSLSQGRVLGTTTPYNLGWLKTEVVDRWQKGDPNLRVIQFESVVNPAFPLEEFERARSTMPGWRFEMFYRGQFSRPAGMVYDCFSTEPGGHVVPDFDIPREWPRYMGLDFGAVNTATVWIAEDPDAPRFVIYRETLQGNLATREHVARAKAAARHENLVAVYGGAPSETQQRQDWTVEGLPVAAPGIADVEGGIARVYGLLKRKRLFVFESCTGLIDEFGTYRRKLDDNGQPTDEIERKREFHRLDALRYVVGGITAGQATIGDYLW